MYKVRYLSLIFLLFSALYDTSKVMYSAMRVIFSIKGNFKICGFVKTKYEYKQELYVTDITKNYGDELHAGLPRNLLSKL